MAWTKKQLDDALMTYEGVLRQAGRTPGTIATYVGDARRFVDWLAGAQLETPSETARLGAAKQPAARTRRGAALEVIPVPGQLSTLVRAWDDAGRPSQAGIAWPRERWTSAFARHRAMFDGLPAALDRVAVRKVAARAVVRPSSSEAAFVASMAWGFGWVGYGPYRTATMLNSAPDVPERLYKVALSLRDEGAVAAYRRLAGDCRIAGLGPAFGTKFIALCQRPEAQPVALIHDELVSSWLAEHGRPDLVSTGWRAPAYEAYLQQMHAWAGRLSVPPEAVEYLIFQAIADARGNQWASAR